MTWRQRATEVSKGFQMVLGGSEEPPACVHQLAIKEFGWGYGGRSQIPPCPACLWCFQNEAWQTRACYKEGVCPLLEKRMPDSWRKDFVDWLKRSRKIVKLARIAARATARKAK